MEISIRYGRGFVNRKSVICLSRIILDLQKFGIIYAMIKNQSLWVWKAVE